MSLAIRIGDRGQKMSTLFYVNAVTRYERSYKSQTSKYPLDSGVSITDHVVNENPVFTLSGIISPADISIRASNTVVTDKGALDTPQNVDKQLAINAQARVENLLTGLKKYLPDVATQFLSMTTEKPKGGQLVVDNTGEILDAIHRMFTSLIYNKAKNSYRNSVVFCSLYELAGVTNNLKGVHNKLVLTDFKGSYDPEHGTALKVEMTFEQVRTVTLQQVEVPVNVSAQISQETALMASETAKDKGRWGSTLIEEGMTQEEYNQKINPTTGQINTSNTLGW